MRVLVTGASGFVGSHTVKALVDVGINALSGQSGDDTIDVVDASLSPQTSRT